MTAEYEWAEGKCHTFVWGDPRSPKGTGRIDDCTHDAKYRVVRDDFDELKCGVHVRRYVKMNNSMWHTDDYFKRPRRPAFYVITELDRP